MRVVNVPLGARSYRILVERRLLARLGTECRRLQLGRRCAVITDSHVASLYAESALASLRRDGFDPILISFAAGERAKNLDTVRRCCDALAAHRLERRSFVVALGGGVVGDVAGFVAATYCRGIAYVQVPTTLLAQVDSSVGGKVGVNLRAGKNLVGAFHQPRLVLCDLTTLQTLADREYRAGLAEVIKYGIIRDVALFRQLERHLPAVLRRAPDRLAPIIARCCRIKAEVVGQDETETGLRAILNFGHTIGHALEAISHYGSFLHGEAIAIGQVAAMDLSVQLRRASSQEAQRVRALFQATGLPTAVRLRPVQRRRLSEAMRRDKKVSEGEIRFVLADRLGRVVFGVPVSPAQVDATLQRMADSHLGGDGWPARIQRAPASPAAGRRSSPPRRVAAKSFSQKPTRQS